MEYILIVCMKYGVWSVHRYKRALAGQHSTKYTVHWAILGNRSRNSARHRFRYGSDTDQRTVIPCSDSFAESEDRLCLLRTEDEYYVLVSYRFISCLTGLVIISPIYVEVLRAVCTN